MYAKQDFYAVCFTSIDTNNSHSFSCFMLKIMKSTAVAIFVALNLNPYY